MHRVFHQILPIKTPVFSFDFIFKTALLSLFLRGKNAGIYYYCVYYFLLSMCMKKNFIFAIARLDIGCTVYSG